MRVALVINALDLGGAERIVAQLARRCPSRGVAPLVCAVREVGELGAELASSGVEVVCLGARGGLRRDPLATMRASLALGRLLLDRRVDLVQGFLFEGNLVARLAARRAGAVAVASFRSNLFRVPWERWAELVSGHLVDRYTAVSRATAAQAAAALAIDPSRITVIRNGVAVPARAVPPRRVRCIGFLGRLHREKGLDLLLRAVARLGRDAPKLLVAGSGPDELALRRLAAELGLSERVNFVGRLGEPGDLLACVDALVVPSRVEGMSNALLEAMAWARPVVATRAGGNAEVVVHGETGLLVAPDDLEALSDAVAELCARGDVAEMGLRARERAIRHFDIETMVDRYVELWRSLVGR